MDYVSFETPDDLGAWLAAHHETATELWVQIFKKGSGTASVDWTDCVIASLTYGWIDGQQKSLDAVSYLQRLTPRRAKSAWSQKNRDHAERLIAQGRMTPAGLRQVTEAKADGRWDVAYAGQATMEIPADFLAALDARPKAKAFFATLTRSNLFAIYHRLHSAKKPETRANRTAKILDQLDREEAFH